MIRFKLKERDEKTGVRTGLLKSNQATFLTPQRSLTSTELNYPYYIRDFAKDIEYPNKLVVAQIMVDAKCLITRDNDNYRSVVKQAQRYTSQLHGKTCIFKPLLYYPKREKQSDGRFRKTKRLLHTQNLNLDTEEIKRIIRSIVHIGHDADFEGVSLPYTGSVFKLGIFKRNIRTAQDYALNQLSSSIAIIPQLPHNDNVVDFERAIYDFSENNPDGIITIPYSSPSAYHYTHDIIKEFSEKDESEKIGIFCLDAPRKHSARAVSHPHYTLLQGYDGVARRIPMPFLREDGKTKDDKPIDQIRRFLDSNLAIEQFDKGLLFDTSEVNTTCQYFRNYTNKELFREAHSLCIHIQVVL